MAIKYKEIGNSIEENIISGVYEQSKKLPTEEELMREYKVSRNTIRKAISLLADRGYIYQVQGSGIFIRETSKEGYITLGNMRGLTGDFPSKKITTKLLELRVEEASEEIAEKMRCAEGTNLYFVKRLRFLDEENFAVEYSYYNKDIVPYLNNEIVEKSIYEYIRKDLKLNIGFADKIIYCDKLDEEHSELLCLDEGDPATIIEDTVFLTNGLIFDISKVIYNYKMAKMLSLASYK
ncbi:MULTISPECIES: GntR family transcriptional regulator [Clostridium]|uniref:GntR family transcriptional regulator n=1 Tax=Clostridium cibarium TaxID=2762247 RepID=A0ABR8PSD7_9CLOT|nr:GntR family transcriptional regulator [Clostridium sp. HBUAS56017]MBD7911096.1 GntR family transcriptional regulator [Clostridium cibarium]